MRVSHFSDHITELQRRIAIYDDELAYKELFGLFYNKLVQFSTVILKSQQSSQEIVSDVFLKIWDKRKTLSEIQNLKLYLYVSVKNNCFSLITKNKNKTDWMDIDDAAINVSSSIVLPDENIISNETIADIQKAINDLPPRCRLIFKLVKEDNLKYKEIAELLDISVKTIDNQLAIALRKIASSIHPELSKQYFAKSG